jgi:hypothetical protein
MAIAQGFGKTSSTGLIFGFDTGDMDNSFIGAPGTNIGMGPNKSYSGLSLSTYSNGKFFRTNGYTETVFIPTLGYRSVESVEVYNVYSGYGTDGNYNCCPNLFNYHGGQEFTGGTTYTYQIIYKCESGYTHPNYMYHYEYGPSGYITEYGVHTESQRTHLGDGWYHAWNTFTTNAATTSGYKGLWYYQYNVPDKISIAAVSIVPGTIIRPPRQFIDEGATRSSTQSLLDLTGNRTINTSNVSFNSTGQMIFDGTDDYIDLGTAPFTGTSDFSIETVYTLDTLDTHTIVGNYPASSLQFMGRYGLYISGSCYFPSSLGPGTYYAAATRESGICRLYLNGVLVTQVSNNNSIGSNSFIMGKNTSNGERLTGKVPVLKLYNRALTSSEIDQNYRHYKTRFNL